MMKLTELPSSAIIAIVEYVYNALDMSDFRHFSASNKNILMYCSESMRRCISVVAQHNPLILFRSTMKLTPIRLFTQLQQPRILIIGGGIDMRRCDQFMAGSGKFKKCCGTHMKRSEEFAAVFHQGLVFAVSGSDPASMGTVECFHPLRNEWLSVPSLPVPLVALSCVSHGGDLYVIGGHERKTALKSRYIYRLDPDVAGQLHDQCSGSSGDQDDSTATHAWQVIDGGLLTGRSHHASVSFNGCIWSVGGLASSQRLATNSVEIFDPETGISHAGPAMVRYRFLPQLVVVHGRLYAVGGDMEETRQSTSSIEVFDASTDSWRFLTFFPLRRPKCSAVAHGSKIFVFGGVSGQQSLSSWDFFDVNLRVWGSQVLQKQDTHKPIMCIDGNEGEKCNKMYGERPQNDYLLSRSPNINTFPGRPKGVKTACAVVLGF